MTYTFALNDLSTCTSAIFVVPRNCKVGLPRILSSANANGFSSRFDLDFPLGVDVRLVFPRSPDADEAESRVRVKLRPSRTMYESGSSSAPRYSRRWFATTDVDTAFDVSVSIFETQKRPKVRMFLSILQKKVDTTGPIVAIVEECRSCDAIPRRPSGQWDVQ